MDKRVEKTEKAIYEGFASILNKKDYVDITIEDILNESGISRSTFYAHYKTKEDVLNSVNDHIFEHVFSHALTVEKTHDFSKSSIFDYSHLLTHILYHLHDEKKLIKAILSNTTKESFYRSIREKIKPLIQIMMQDASLVNKALPLELNVSKISETFILVIDYWFSNDCKETPEKIISYFYLLNK